MRRSPPGCTETFHIGFPVLRMYLHVCGFDNLGKSCPLGACELFRYDREGHFTDVAPVGERVKNLEELADYYRGLLKDSEWRYQQAMEQLGASQRTVETLTKALPAADAGTPAQRRRWWPFGRR